MSFYFSNMMKFLTPAMAWTTAVLTTAPAISQDIQLKTIVEETAKSAKAGAILDIHGCGISYRGSAGVSNRKTKASMPINEPLRIASVGKLYTAAIIHQLVRDGQLDLDRSIQSYLDESDTRGVPNLQATLRQLLNHTSGIPDYYDARSYLLRDWRKPIDTDFVLSVARRRKAKTAPGQAYGYSNTNYHLLALAAESVTGKPLSQLMQEIIIKPLDLRQTQYHTSHPGGVIHGYGTELRSWVDTWKYAENTGPDSGITATTSDLNTFLAALFLQDGSMNALGKSMQADEVAYGSGRTRGGAGAEILVGRDGLRLVGHTGDIFGYLTFAFAIPDYQATIIGHINAKKPNIYNEFLRTTVGAMRQYCKDSLE